MQGVQPWLRITKQLHEIIFYRDWDQLYGKQEAQQRCNIFRLTLNEKFLAELSKLHFTSP